LPAQSAAGGRNDVVEAEVVAEHRVGRSAGLLREQIVQADVASRRERPDRRHMALRIKLQTLVVDAAVEVDGEARDTGDRAIEANERGAKAALGTDEHAAGQAEVAIQPGVEEHAAVRLDGDLMRAVGAGLGARLDPEVGQVGVRAYHAEAGFARRRGADLEREDRGASAHDVDLVARSELPAVALVERAVTGGLQ